MRMKLIREIFQFLIQSMLFINKMNPFPKIPVMSSTAEIRSRVFSKLDMSVDWESLPSIHC